MNINVFLCGSLVIILWSLSGMLFYITILPYDLDTIKKKWKLLLLALLCGPISLVIFIFDYMVSSDEDGSAVREWLKK